MQFHGTADRYTLNGATAVATLYSNASTATTNPAVTLRSVGASGGQAAAFTYDLARSIVLTRQGNPSWVGQERDGVVGIRPDDLFFGASAGDVQPDWLDTAKIDIPQADEQQRLLANLIETHEPRPEAVPRFWYLPRSEKAAVVMTGDDHAFGGTAGRFDQYKAASPAGCSVVLWECVRGTSYLYPASPLTNAQAAQYVSEGFEVSVHVTVSGALSCTDWTPASLAAVYTAQIQQFTSKYTSVPAPATHRLHCVGWADWATQPKVELAHGIRFDTNYYHYPAGWIGALPGYMTGSATIMRFADTDGTPIDVYQAHTHMDDEASQAYPATVNALLDAAVGAKGYYGVFTANMHTDQVDVGRLRRDRRLRPEPERSRRLGQADARLGRRTQQLVVRRLLLERQLAPVRGHAGSGCDRLDGHASDAIRHRHAELGHPKRSGDDLHDAGDQGHLVRALPGTDRKLRRRLRQLRLFGSRRSRRAPANELDMTS